MAKGKPFNRLAQYLQAKAPQMGMFSTLDELVQSAPFEQAPLEEWKRYLSPGKIFEREGVQFPLKQEELDYSNLGKLEPTGALLDKEWLRRYIHEQRPEFRLTIGSADTSPTGQEERKAIDSILRGETSMESLPGTTLDANGLYEAARDKLYFESPKYGDYSLAPGKDSDPGYEESITRLRDLEGRSHFSPDVMSWSRSSRHNLYLPPRKARLVDEIQSDLHSQAGEKGFEDPETGLWSSTEDTRRRAGFFHARDLDEASRELAFGHLIPRRLGYKDPEKVAQLAKDRALATVESNDRLAERDHPPFPRDPLTGSNMDEFGAERKRALAYEEAQGRLEDISARLSQEEQKPQDAPFKNPADYARLELRKQLLNAVNADEDSLALVRGQDQIDRYEGGMDDRRAAGMRYMYDEVYPSVLKKLAKQYGAEMEDVPLLVRSGEDLRLTTMQDHGWETADDVLDSLDDFNHSGGPEFWPEAADTYGNLASELEAKLLALFPTREHRSSYQQGMLEDLTELQRKIDNHYVETRDAAELYKADRAEGLPEGDALAQAHQGLTHGLLAEIQKSFHALWEDYTTRNAQGWRDDAGEVQFPAMKLTPEVKERVKKAGVPLFSVGAGAILQPDDDEPQGHAKGGLISDLLYEIVDRHTGEVVSQPYRNKKRARTRADKLDNDYGAYRYQVREKKPVVTPDASQDTGLEELRQDYAKGGRVYNSDARNERARLFGRPKAPSPDEAVQRLVDLGDSQRGSPEQAMLDVQKIYGGGVLSPVVEHTGDLIHRMSHHANYGSAYPGLVRDKVEKVLDALNYPYGFQREMGENIERNARYFGDNEPGSRKEAVDQSLTNYADEHRKLPAYNRPQYFAREAAVAVGEQRWNDATRHLQSLQKLLDLGDDEFERLALKIVQVPKGYAKGGKIKSLGHEIERGLNVEHPEVARSLYRYTHHGDERGLQRAFSSDQYGEYQDNLHRLLRINFPSGKIPVTHVFDYAGYPTGGPYMSVSTHPHFGDSSEARGSEVRRFEVPIEDVLAAGNREEGELIIPMPEDLKDEGYAKGGRIKGGPPAKPAPLGKCFENSVRYIWAHPDEDLVLVHGTVQGTGGNAEGKRYGHAWVERRGDSQVHFEHELPPEQKERFSRTAIDVTTDERLKNPLEVPSVLYRGVGQARDVMEYDKKKMNKLLKYSKHFGPWELPDMPDESGYAEGGLVEPDEGHRLIDRANLGFQEQWKTLNPETDEAEWGTRPGIIDETLSLPAFLGELGVPAIQRHILPPLLGEQQPRPGEEWKAPNWSHKALDRAMSLEEALRKEHNLAPPRGFLENAAEAAGTMLGQLPTPWSRLKSVGPLAKAMKKIAGSPLEWFSPTIDPKLANYAVGTGFGGGLGTLLQGPEESDQEEDGPSDAEIEQLLNRMLLEHMTKEAIHPRRHIRSPLLDERDYAKGGKVSNIGDALYKKLQDLGVFEDTDPADWEDLKNDDGSWNLAELRSELDNALEMREEMDDYLDTVGIDDSMSGDEIADKVRDKVVDPLQGGTPTDLQRLLDGLRADTADLARMRTEQDASAPDWHKPEPPAKLPLPSDVEQLKRMWNQSHTDWWNKKQTWEEHKERADPIMEKMVRTKQQIRREAGRGVNKPIFKKMMEIPHGTKVTAVHGLKYPKPTIGTVTGTKTIQLDDGIFNLPRVDFGDGKPRTVFPGDIHEVYLPHDFAKGGKVSGIADKLVQELRDMGVHLEREIYHDLKNSDGSWNLQALRKELKEQKEADDEMYAEDEELGLNDLDPDAAHEELLRLLKDQGGRGTGAFHNWISHGEPLTHDDLYEGLVVDADDEPIKRLIQMDPNSPHSKALQEYIDQGYPEEADLSSIQDHVFNLYGQVMKKFDEGYDPTPLQSQDQSGHRTVVEQILGGTPTDLSKFDTDRPFQRPPLTEVPNNEPIDLNSRLRQLQKKFEKHQADEVQDPEAMDDERWDQQHRGDDDLDSPAGISPEDEAGQMALYQEYEDLTEEFLEDAGSMDPDRLSQYKELLDDMHSQITEGGLIAPGDDHTAEYMRQMRKHGRPDPFEPPQMAPKEPPDDFAKGGKIVKRSSINFVTDDLQAKGMTPNQYDAIHNPAYRQSKNVDAEVVHMSPREYIEKAAEVLSKAEGRSVTSQDLVEERMANQEYLQKMIDEMEKGTPFATPYLNYQTESQEGIHRSLAAEALGAKTVPVVVIKPNARSVRDRQAKDFHEWAKTQELPPGFDRETLEMYSLNNASDVSPEQVNEVAQSTWRMYLDDLDFARESGILSEDYAKGGKITSAAKTLSELSYGELWKELERAVGAKEGQGLIEAELKDRETGESYREQIRRMKAAEGMALDRSVQGEE